MRAAPAKKRPPARIGSITFAVLHRQSRQQVLPAAGCCTNGPPEPAIAQILNNPD